MKYRTVGLVDRNAVRVLHFVVQKIMKQPLGHLEVKNNNFGKLAQLVEHRPLKPNVIGSNPVHSYIN